MAATIVAAVILSIREWGTTPAAEAAIGAGWVLIVCGITLVRLRPATARCGLLMTAAGLAWLAGALLYLGPLGHMLLTWPTARGSRSMIVPIAALYLIALAGSFGWLQPAAVVSAIVLGVTATARLGGTSGLVRRARLGSTVAALAIASAILLPWGTGIAADVNRMPAAFILLAVVVAGSAVALTWDAARGPWAGSGATGLVVQLGGPGGARTLEQRLAAAVGDPTLVLAYQRDGALVDAGGASVELVARPGRSLQRVRDGATELAVIDHDDAVLDDPALAEAAAAAVWITIANERLRADIEDRVAGIEASRLRIQAAADEQRRAVELQLADGALRRLQAARGLLASRAVALNEELDLDGTAASAETELRAFARGVYPPLLERDGLAAAVADLAGADPMPVRLSIPPTRLARELEATAYFVVAEALANASKHADASAIAVEAGVAGDTYRLTVRDDGAGGADPAGRGLSGIRERVATAGGTLDVSSPAGRGTVVTVTLPVSPPGRAAGPGSVGAPGPGEGPHRGG